MFQCHCSFTELSLPQLWALREVDFDCDSLLGLCMFSFGISVVTLWLCYDMGRSRLDNLLSAIGPLVTRALSREIIVPIWISEETTAGFTRTCFEKMYMVRVLDPRFEPKPSHKQ